ncbi:class I SAM-dependent methyltransferase [Bacillus sp. DTU_2020_1000418_1_SI_GHA_SEK_038]|uniref:class I SAM-dependent methyltransferase n=1 Tax=Bacillus sp. DTU_2020_1000418_1_SI_GHA_SEK_038 TaxID=3077585 RepID=UPI0028EF6E5B|nr:class I SAM-dependent methyltransferase [Bacillus sp. DTU_2020_1000418_1_SI_GHA_SEK_038]WNS75031.1 class I SAM-dependent methyltransferase [Bacillus sp. DTU_2020_1000418_1_SI_GHA_SEK_038]
MLNNQGFNLWADNYDKTVQVSEENNLYPFAGYKKILNTIFNEVMQKINSKVLDIGFGTGVLTSKLYEAGHQIDGLDFSSKMISIAKLKMPKANLIEWDISNGIPAEYLNKKYDAIVSTYTLHHLTDKEKISFIKTLIPLLKEEGKIFIGDISFEAREHLEECRKESIDYWDHDEFYFVYEEIESSLKNDCHCEFYPISHCGGVFVITKR